MRTIALILFLAAATLGCPQAFSHLWSPLDLERYGGKHPSGGFGTLVVLSSDALGPKAFMVADAPVEEVRRAGMSAFGRHSRVVRDRRTLDLATVEFRFSPGPVELRPFPVPRPPLRIYMGVYGGKLSSGESQRDVPLRLAGWPEPGTLWTARREAGSSVRVAAVVSPILLTLFAVGSTVLLGRMAFGPIRGRWLDARWLFAAMIGLLGTVNLRGASSATDLPLLPLWFLSLLGICLLLVTSITLRAYRSGGLWFPVVLSVVAGPLVFDLLQTLLSLTWPELRAKFDVNLALLLNCLWVGVFLQRSVVGTRLRELPQDDPIVRRARAMGERAGTEIDGVWMTTRSQWIAAIIPYRRIVLSWPLRDGLEPEELDAVLAHEIGHLLPGRPRPFWLPLLSLLLVVAVIAVVCAPKSDWIVLLGLAVTALPAMFLTIYLSLPFRRQAEFDADAWMLRITGDREACESMLRKLHENQKPDADDRWSTHPNLNARIAALRAEAAL